MIPASGAVSASHINTELGRTAGSLVSLDDRMVRLLSRTLAKQAPGTTISLADMRGAWAVAVTLPMQTLTGSGEPGVVGARSGENGQPTPLFNVGTPTSYGVLGLHTGERASGSQLVTQLVLNTSSFVRPFWAIGVFSLGGTHLGTLNGADASIPFGGILNWYLSSGMFDLRPYLGQSLRFVFVGP